MNKNSKAVLFGLFFLILLSFTCIYESISYNYDDKKNILQTISNKSVTITLSSSFISDEYAGFVYEK